MIELMTLIAALLSIPITALILFRIITHDASPRSVHLTWLLVGVCLLLEACVVLGAEVSSPSLVRVALAACSAAFGVVLLGYNLRAMRKT